MRGRAGSRNFFYILVLGLAAALSVLVGQWDRELLPPDDLREAEIGREMWLGGDYLTAQFDGLPFVDKPPGFYAVEALAYASSGGATENTARIVSAAFAILTLVAVFLLGKRAANAEAAGLAVALLAFSSRFSRTAHSVLLDNALTTAVAFAMLFLWVGLKMEDARAKQWAYAACGFSLGISFLFKGFVGPALFAAGVVSYLVATRRFAELRHALRPLPIAAFLLPVLLWMVPFVARASPERLHTFFIDNHWGRAFGHFASNVRPVSFYALDIWIAFLPGALLLPFAAFSALRNRHAPEGEAPIFFLSFAVAPLVLLSVSKQKDSVYALPAYPALALLVAVWCERGLQRAGRWAPLGVGIAILTLAAAAAGAIIATALFGGLSWRVVAASALLSGILLFALRILREGALRGATAIGACIAALAWTLFFTGPLAAHEIARRTIRGPVEAALVVAGNRPVLLYDPSDGIRGAASFWHHQTAEEVSEASALVRRLLQDDGSLALLHRLRTDPIPLEVRRAAEQLHAQLIVEGSFPCWENRVVTVFRARPAVPTELGSSFSAPLSR
ncbi:MAG TPA: glycosyltransferase family 39 protein [Myxococcota bacterium]|nr:glycosyltransferase family 39 protein [Myxococcota bacterium]